MNKEKKCTEVAKVTLSWGGKLLNYCPVHANQIASLGNAIGNPVQAQLIKSTVPMECESSSPLSKEEKVHNKKFPIG